MKIKLILTIEMNRWIPPEELLNITDDEIVMLSRSLGAQELVNYAQGEIRRELERG